jgi:YYY domain-containing protein
MELAIFNAILRSPWFPPYDPWFAGGVLHYYYFGYVPWATISRLTGIVPEVAFNLAFPAVFGLVLLNAWSAAATLLAHVRRPDPAAQDEATPASWKPILLALAAPAFAGLLGNLDFVRRLGRGEWGYAPAPSWIGPFGQVGTIGWGIRNAFAGEGSLPNDAFWGPTRVIPNTINEFPYFTLLFGDLHAHLLAMPIVTAVIVVAAGIATSSRARSALISGIFGTLGGWRTAIPLGLLCGLLGGILIASNTWDYPPAMALIVVSAIACALAGPGFDAPWRVVRDVALFAALVLISGRLFFQPYLSHYGTVPSQTVPAVDTTRLSDYLTIHGVMLFAIGGYLAIELTGSMRFLDGRGGWGRPGAILFTVVPVVGLVLAVLAGNTAIFLVVSLATVAVCTIGRWRSASHLFVLAMIALGLGLALFAETWQFVNDVGRMNTVFKLYLHAWLLLGIAAAVASVQVIGRIREAIRGRRTASAGSSFPRFAGVVAAPAWIVALAILVAGAAAYPAMVTAPRLADRFESLDPTLDGLAYMDAAVVSDGPDGGEPSTFPLANDRIAIEWLRHNVDGSPVILEAQLSAYRWGGRISSNTGLPTVLGWTWHEKQQRPGYHREVDQRVADIATIYGGVGLFDSIRPLLDTYHVELIYVGDLERAVYGDPALARFADAADRGQLDVLYDANGVTIYAYPGETGSAIQFVWSVQQAGMAAPPPSASRGDPSLRSG